MWRILSGRRSKRNDLGQSEKIDKAHAVTNQRPPQVAEQPQTTGEPRRPRQTVRGPSQVVEERPAMVHPSPQTDAEQQPETGTGHPQISSHVSDEPRATVHSPPQTYMEQQPQTDMERRQMVRWPPQVAEERPAMVHPPPQINAERQLETDTMHLQTVREPPQISEEPPATVSVEDLETDDIVIAAMGPTGSGKSMFIRLASGCDTQGVGHTLRSFTNHVVAVRFWDQESGRHVVLVDTPGFDDTSKSDLDILNMISDWLNSSYKKGKLLSGILYLHRITDNRMAGTLLKNLRAFRKLCGRDALGKVYLTTTMWDEVDQSVGERRLDELKTDYWKAMINQGAQIVRCRSDDDSPKRVIRQILGQEAVRKGLLLQEMAALKKELEEIGGQELYSQLEKLVEKHIVLLWRIDKERKAGSAASVLVALQTEYDDLRVQINNQLRQLQEPKSSRFKNLLGCIFWDEE